MVHLYNIPYKYPYNTHINNEVWAICKNADGLGGYYAKRNKSDEDKYCMISLIWGISNIQQISEFIGLPWWLIW